MTDSDEKVPRRPKKRQRSVSIGGTSQSAFAGYAPKAGKKSPKNPKKKVSPKTETDGSD